MVTISRMVAFTLGLILLHSVVWSGERVIKCEGPGCEHVLNNAIQNGQSPTGAFVLKVEALPDPLPPPSWVWPQFSAMELIIWLGLLAVLFAGAVFMLLAMIFRIVVSTNDVHIVQSASRTVSYGKDQAAGNSYYKWPSWVPLIGVRVIILPVSVFNVTLDDYSAYDKGRLPFRIDVMAFFRIEDSNVAAQRVHSFEELKQQLQGILQGAIRSILAGSEIEEILGGRAEFGGKFTVAVAEQLKAWGVVNVKNVELMDIRDAKDSKVIDNIMAKKKSLIEKESRMAVAENLKLAQTAEIEADQIVNVRKQEALQAVGERTAEKERVVGIATQQSQQAVKQEEAATAEKEMAISRVMVVRQAEIQKDSLIVEANQKKQQVIIAAEAALDQANLHAAGVKVEGEAKGLAETAVLMAPVNSQIALAKEIGSNEGYQAYLVKLRDIEKNQAVGIEQAQALQKADIKVIASGGTMTDGIGSLGDLVSANGGTKIAGLLEALAQSPTGQSLVERFLPPKSTRRSGGDSVDSIGE